MSSLGFYLCTMFYSLMIFMEYICEPNNYFILLLLVAGLIILIPIKINLRGLIIAYLVISMALTINTFYNSIFVDGEKNIALVLIGITAFILSKFDINGIVGILSFFLFIILIIYIYIILTTIRIPMKPSFNMNFKALLIPIDLLILNNFRPKEYNKYLCFYGYISMIFIIFIISVITYSHYGSYINDFNNPGLMIFKIQYYFDEIGGYDFVFYYIIPVLTLLRLSINMVIIKKLGFKEIIYLLCSFVLSFVDINLVIPLVIGAIIMIGGIYGNIRKI